MLKTLKIARFIMAVAAIGFISYLAMAGFAPDEDMLAIINRETAIDKIKKLKLNELNNDRDKESTLVTQAKAFALWIDPPPPPAPPQPKENTKVAVKTPPKTTPTKVAPPPPPPPPKKPTKKFTLVATCKYESVPEKSLAMIDIVSEGNKWVRQGDTVGHLTIQEVKDGSIVLYANGQLEGELFVPKPPAKNQVRSLLRDPDDKTTSKSTPASTTITSASRATTATRTAPATSAISRPREVGVRSTARPADTPVEPTKRVVRSPEEEKKILEDNISQIKNIMAEAMKENSSQSTEEVEAWERLLGELQKSQNNAEPSDIDSSEKEPVNVNGKKPSLPLELQELINSSNR